MSDPPASGPAGRGRGLITWAALLALVASAVVASNLFSVRDRLFGSATPKPAAPVASRVAGGSTTSNPVTGATGTTAPVRETSLRSQPWWQDVSTLDGSGASTSSPFTISDSALQWRVNWSCAAGQLVVQAPRRPKPLVQGACPQGGPVYATQTGMMTLQVTADGPWHLQVAQEIDAPLVEPPAPVMTGPGASVVAGGSFYKIDQTGTGKATLYHQADGGYSLRLEDFFVTPTTDLELRLSALDAPHSSPEVVAAKSALVKTMDVTAGSLNFTVPSTVDPKQFRSLYVWCALTQSAYAGASLVPTR